MAHNDASPIRPHHSDYSELVELIRDAGLLRRRYAYYWARLAAAPVVVVVGLIVFLRIGDTWWQLITAAAFGLVFAQIAFLGHDAAHRQIFYSGRWNDWTSIVLGDLLVGMSFGWWRTKHTLHHGNPNRRGIDPDLAVPVIAVSSDRAARLPALARWFMGHQGLLFFPILPLEGVSLHVSSVRRVLHPEPVAHRWVEILLLTVRLGGFIALAFVVLSPGVAAAFLAVQVGVFGFCMGAAFAPNHKGMPIVGANVTYDFLRRQVLMSRNIRGTRLLDVAMGGLNFQIEHHLFPSMPRPHLRRAAPIVRAYCRRMGVPYTETGLVESYGIVIRYLNRVGVSEHDPFECPLVAQRRAL